MSTGAIPAFYVVTLGRRKAPFFVMRDELLANRNLMEAVQAQLEQQAKELDEAALQKRLIAAVLAEMAGRRCARRS